MPAWLIAVIILILLALSSQNEKSTRAGHNANEGYQRGNEAKVEWDRRIETCGTRCNDVMNDYNQKIERQ